MENTKISSLSHFDTEVDTASATTSDLGRHLLEAAQTTIDTGAPLHLTLPINPTDYEVGTALAQAITERYGGQGLAEGTVNVTFHGRAGQRFGALNTSGVELTLIGRASDLVGQEMCGGQIVVRPSLKSQLVVNNGIVVGHSVLDGATGGNLFVAGRAGPGFAVRNRGATAVVEGIGDDGCQAMTGGVVVVLGQTGHDFAVDMRGGLTFVLDEAHFLCERLHADAVQPERVTQAADAELLKHLIKRHVRLTGSVCGQTILENWSDYLAWFWKVRPRDIGVTETSISQVL